MKMDRIDPVGPETREQMLADLHADLEAAAALAGKRDEPLWRWLIEKADAEQALPLHSGRVRIAAMVAEAGVAGHTARRYQPLADEWIERFARAFGDANAGIAPFDPENRPEIDPERFEELEQRAAAIEAEMAEAPDHMQPAYRWLAALARQDGTLPVIGPRPNMRAISKRMGVSYDKALMWGDVFRRWAGSFAKSAKRSTTRRDRLPGSTFVGTDLPVGALIAGLELDLKREAHPASQAMLRRLIAIAREDRTVPRGHASPHLTALLRSAGVEGDVQSSAAKRVLDDWLGFFELDDQVTRIRPDGTVERERRVAHEVAELIAELRGDGTDMIPLEMSAKAPFGPSFRAIERRLNLPIGTVAISTARQLVLSYWEEAGPGPKYQGRSKAELQLRNRRRTELVVFAKSRADRGLPLPGWGRPIRLDHDALVKLSGKPGPNLADDSHFKTLLRKLDPPIRLERMDDLGGRPDTYRQLIDGMQREGVANAKKSSHASIRSQIKGAVESFHLHLGKDAAHAIGDDFKDEKEFDKSLNAIVAAGRFKGTPTNFRSMMKRARAWYLERQNSDMLGDEFDAVLSGAVLKDGRGLPDILKGTGFNAGQVTNWMRGMALPSKEARPGLSKLATNLGLDPDRLTKLMGGHANGSPTARLDIELGDRVREFLPDDWPTRNVDEVRAMAEWIETNLTHMNTVYGRTMQEVAKRRHARERSERQLADEVAAAVETTETEQALTPELIEANKRIGELVGRQVDEYLDIDVRRLGKRVVLELRALRRHMTLNFPDDLRRAGVKWETSSTAPMKIGMLSRFLKWQTLSEDEGGLGRDPEDLTLADVLHPPLVFAYIDYKAAALEHVEDEEGEKRGKIFTGTEVDLLRTVKSLVSAELGFVTQKPEWTQRIVADDRPLPRGSFIGDDGHVYDKKEDHTVDKQEETTVAVDLPPAQQVMPAKFSAIAGDDFVKACRRAEHLYNSAQAHVDEEADMVRDPMEPITPILDTPQPMTTLLRQIAIASKRVPDLGMHPVQHHLHKRDVLMTRLLALTALRNKNMRQITVDGTAPKLRFDQIRGQWLLEIDWREFKNYRSALLFGRRRKRQPYRKWIENRNGLYDLIDYYLSRSRAFFQDEKTRKPRTDKNGDPRPRANELFLSSTGKKLTGPETWRAVNRFTARHIAWNPFRNEGLTMCQPFGPHAFRDIRATDILLNPETSNPYMEAAFALQTSPQMIQDHYGSVKVEKRTALDDISFHKREDLAWAGLDDED